MQRKILFVNSQSTTLLMEQMLFAQRADYSLIVARDAKDAIRKAEMECPDLILMDSTPRNADACREMRKIKKLQRVPIILVASPTDSPHCENGTSSECNNDLSESMQWRGLLDMVNTYLTTHGVTTSH